MLLQVFRELLDGHPVYSRIPFIGLDSLQCLLAVFQLADFFHQSFGFSQAFSLSLRHQRFEPFLGDLRSITLTFHRKGQHPLFGLVFLSLSAHESRRLLALSFIPLSGYRSGLRSSFPARPICCSAFRLSECLNSFADCMAYFALCRLLRQGQVNRFTLSHDSVTCRRSPEVSLTAFDAQPPDLPPVDLMDMGFVVNCLFARHRRPRIRFLFIGSRLCSTLLSGLASRRV